MPAENLQGWSPRVAPFYEDLAWEFSVTDLERDNYVIAAKFAKLANREFGHSSSAKEFSKKYPIKNSTEYRKLRGYLLTITNQHLIDELRRDNAIDMMSVTAALAFQQGPAAAMNDAFAYFHDFHLSGVLEEDRLSGAQRFAGKNQRDIFNMCLDSYFGLLPPYLIERVQNEKLN